MSIRPFALRSIRPIKTFEQVKWHPDCPPEDFSLLDTAINALTTGKRSRRRRTLQTDEISNVFGIDLEDDESKEG